MLAEENELLTILEDNDRDVRGDRRLYLVVQPSALVQLGCYIAARAHVRQTLSGENQDRLVGRVRTVLHHGRYDRLDICWFGGEPLLGLDIMRSLTKAAHCQSPTNWDTSMRPRWSPTAWR